MDEPERQALEREVQIHLARVEELLAALKELEEEAAKSDPPPGSPIDGSALSATALAERHTE